MKRERTYYTENPIIKEELRRYLKENIQEFYDKVEAQAREEKSFSNENAAKFIQSRLEECLSLNKMD